ncbi:MAG: right-handed parallel beta-helix repeat-containing protein [Phycisphaeraceae bacterium]|nr:right-handed parallel beta-helix repeat-containing protein [Phycisphaeraceae bacterium]
MRLSRLFSGRRNLADIAGSPNPPQANPRFPGLEPLEPRLLLSGTAYVIDSLLDVVANDGHLTLREAILAANTNASVNEAAAGSGSETDSITFAPSLFAGGHADLILSGTELSIIGDLSITGPGQELLSIDADQKSRVFNISGSGTDVAMEGLTITGGFVTNKGGGVSVDTGNTITLTSCTISGNQANNSSSGIFSYGGGLAVWSGAATLINCTVSDNRANGTGYGGGVFSYRSTATLADCTINDNWTGNTGGGICSLLGTLTLSNCTINDNWASFSGGGVRVDGGDTVTLTGCEISANSVNTWGGGLFINGYSVAVTLAHCVISENSTIRYEGGNSNGGGLYVDSGAVTLTNSLVSENTAAAAGGALYVYNYAIVTLINSVVRGNAAAAGGGFYLSHYATVTLVNGIVNGNSAQSSSGGGLFVSTFGQLQLTNSTISGNSAMDSGGGLYIYSQGASPGKATLNNTIVAINSAPTDPNVFGAYTAFAGFIGGDPKFIRNPLAGLDGIWGTADDDLGDLHLSVDSTCIDSGIDSLAVDANGNLLAIDFGGHHRIAGVQVDIGAYEFEVGGIRGDFNGDWQVTLSDIEHFKLAITDPSSWQVQYPSIPLATVDPNGDGAITLTDINAFKALLIGNETVYVVDSLDDTVANDGQLTLREAILAANKNTAVNEAPAGSINTDKIIFDPTLFASGSTNLILSGMELQITSDLDITGPGQDLLSIDAVNLSRVFSISGGGTEVALKGLTVTGGYTADSGGGLIVWGGSTVALTSSMVAGNSAYYTGGGLRVEYGALTLNNTTISDNVVESAAGFWGAGQGGGLYVAEYGTVTMSNCIVSGNLINRYDGYGGGVCVYGDSATLSNCTISGNQRGGVYAAGGTITLTNSTVSGNSASYSGGGMFVDGGTVTLANCTIGENSARSNGGGVYASSSVVTLTNCTVSGNSADGDNGFNGGGGLCLGLCTVMLSNCTVKGNSSRYGGGAFISQSTGAIINSVVSENSAQLYGGGVSIESDSAISLTNCIANGDSAFRGGGVYVDQSSATLSNCTISGNAVKGSSARAGGLYISGSSVAINNSIAAFNAAPNDPDVSGPYTASSSFIGGDPKFIDNPTAGLDGIWGTGDDDLGNLHLRVDSPCVDAGNNALAVDADGNPLTIDLDGRPRMAGAQVDIGAYELGGIPADFNGDGQATASDIEPFKLALTDTPAWQAQYPGVPLWAIDPNGDGSITLSDINAFKALLAGSAASSQSLNVAPQDVASGIDEPRASASGASISSTPLRSWLVDTQLPPSADSSWRSAPQSRRSLFAHRHSIFGDVAGLDDQLPSLLEAGVLTNLPAVAVA